MDTSLDIFIKSGMNGDAQFADNAAFAEMQKRARAYKAAENEGNRLRIHLVLRNKQLATALRRIPVSEEFAKDIELYTYTNEDLHSMKILGIEPGATPLLVREKVGYESNKRVHLVIFGAGEQAASLAIHAALTSHLPNYCRDSNLRTRITWFADRKEEFQDFFRQYNNLLEHSYRRMVDIDAEEINAVTLAPAYAHERRDFVDIEWEFVTGRSYCETAQHKLQQWNSDEEQMLTIAFCYDDNNRNLNEALSLPACIREKSKTIIRTGNATAIDYLRSSREYANIIPFGNHDAEPQCLSSYIMLAQYINFAYSALRDATGEERKRGLSDIAVATEIPSAQQVQQLWNNDRLNSAKRWSNIYNAFMLNIKMFLLDIPSEKWSTLFAINERDVKLFTEVEHNRWSVEELILGYRPASKEQHCRILKEPALRDKLKQESVHDDLRHFSELGTDSTGLSVSRYDAGLTRTLPLIAHIYNSMKGEKL